MSEKPPRCTRGAGHLWVVRPGDESPAYSDVIYHVTCTICEAQRHPTPTEARLYALGYSKGQADVRKGTKGGANVSGIS